MAVDIHPDTHSATDLEKAFLENHEMVYRTAFRLTGNASDAEDVLQIVFLRLVRRAWTPESVDSWSAYLHRAAVNVALDILRTRSRQPSIPDGELLIQESRPDPHQEYSAAELRRVFAAAVAKLKPAAAEMFVLRYVEGYTVQEIARMLDTTKSTVAVTLFRARTSLRKSIRKLTGEK